MSKEHGYLGNNHVKKDGVITPWTQDEIIEYKKCMEDPVYFAKKYCKVIHLDRGLVNFELYPYQEEMFDHFNTNRFSIVLACRQSGKSISSVAYILWFALFHSEKNIAILANKGATAREMLARVTLMLENLPFFLQPGTKALNKGSIEFSNNSKILASATSGSSIRGLSINLLFLDEFAFVENDAQFYTSTYPVVSSGKDTKVIITSTANGIGNVFHKIWEGAMQKTNQFIPFRVDWWDVPGRDEIWKQQTVGNTSQLQFDQEFGNTFFGTGDTLIDADVAKGRGQDYSTFNIIDISTVPFQQVAVYRNNRISPILFPDIIAKFVTAYNNAYVIIESNDQGALVCNGLYQDLEYENMHVESATKNSGLGVEMTRKVKRIGCSGFKDILESHKLDIVDEQTIIEISTFESKGNSFEASNGNHDDLVMNLVMFGYFASSAFFSDMTDINIKDMLFKQRMEEIEADVLPFGFTDDGLNDIPPEVDKDRLGWALSDKWDLN